MTYLPITVEGCYKNVWWCFCTTKERIGTIMSEYQLKMRYLQISTLIWIFQWSELWKLNVSTGFDSVVILLFLVHTGLPVLQINTVFPDSLDSCFLSQLSFTKIRPCTSVWALLPLLHSLGKRQIIKALCSCSLFHQLDHFQSSSVGVSLWLLGCWCCLSSLYNYLSRCLSDLYLLNVLLCLLKKQAKSKTK